MLADRDPTRFLKDVITQPSIGPVSGWLIGGLIALVVYLTWTFAPGAAERADLPHGDDEAGVIPVWAGFVAIGVVSVLSISAGLEPYLSPRLGRWFGWLGRLVRPRPSDGLFRLGRRDLGFWIWVTARFVWPFHLFYAVLLRIIGFGLFFIWRAPSILLSFFDWTLARPIAWLAGATLRPWYLRYGWLCALITAAGIGAWVLPPPLGLYAAIAGIIAIVAVVRRWNWIERDREAFLAARVSDPKIERVGFAEDLRDEALISIVFLFVLVPLALRQVDLTYDAFGFDPNAPITGTWLHQLLLSMAVPQDAWIWEFLDWVGYFGAELAKAVPLVDWSEVFHVANDSPIRVQSVLGSQILFSMRATLDLLLIAAVVQAIQVASRMRDQSAAFWAGRLPILDPFAERRAFRVLFSSFEPHPHIRLTDQPDLATFPRYERDRLVQISFGAGPEIAEKQKSLKDPTVREAGLIALAGQYPDDKSNEDLAHFIDNAPSEDDGLVKTAARLIVEDPGPHSEGALIGLLENADRATELRLAAIRYLPRVLKPTAAQNTIKHLHDILKSQPQAELWAHGALALAKIEARNKGMGDSEPLLRRLAGEMPQDNPADTMTVAYALGLTSDDASDALAALFPTPSKQSVIRAIQSARGKLDAVQSLPAGKFLMGSTSNDKRAYSFERPQHEVEVPAFAIGVYAVTFEEYDLFCDLTDREKPRDFGRGRERRPAIDVSWHDAHAYCDWLRAWTGEDWRLPSEAEWEYACRAGRETAYSFGDDETSLDDHAWWYGNSEGRTHPVGEKALNAFGPYDMHGNVWEWCQDAWNVDYRELRRPDDGRPWLTGNRHFRVLRGGSWNNSPQYLRSANRIGVTLTNRDDDSGFRIARTLEP